ncbi:MAG TPA: winged helix-turn-helix domain-containing protein [Steroidobacteraceae bacterium]|nr:winged helix-turn-helix domain-containing protein [Steroidobacteraceae bacterium]
MPNGTSGDLVRIGAWIANPALDTIACGTETHKLEPRTMRLLLYLANSAGAVVSVDQLLTDVWSGVVVGSASVYQAVSQLRKLLGDLDPDPTYIETVPRKGYRLIASVRRIRPEREMAATVPIPTDPDPANPDPAATAAPTPVPAPASALARAPAPAAAASVIAASAAAASVALVDAPGAHPYRSIYLVLGGAAVVALMLTGTLIWKRAQSPDQAAAAASIVVLPFIDLTAEKADQSFCDGLTEELSSWLSQIPTLRVVARTSAFAFRGQGEDVRKIGKALDTDHILEGSMRRSGDHVRITVQLIDARNGYHLWSENFDRPIQDAINVQEDISRSVAEVLKLRLTTESERQFAVRRTADPQAYQLYLLARHFDQQLAPEPTERAVDLYRQVLNADPNFALAYIGLAKALLNQAYYRDLPISDVAASVEPLVAAALRIDDRSSGAYAVRGMLRASQSREKEALADLAQAISLDPSNMGAHAAIGKIRLFDGRPREALQNYDAAAALDPLNSRLQIQRCTAFGDLAQYGEAEKVCERARILQPGSAAPADSLAWLAESRGRIEEALRWNAESLKAEPGDDFDLYWTRATLFLAVGLTAPARAAVELGRRATKDDSSADTALVRVVYREGGAQALRSYLDSAHLDQSAHAVSLFEAAYSRLLLGDAAAVKGLIARALAAPDRQPDFADAPWYARGERAAGISYRLDLAAAELQLGDRPSAERNLNTVLAMVDAMLAAGVERYATYELRAKIHALKGQSDDAMRDFGTAVRLGWRRAWWASHEPYFDSLRSRSDFQALLAQVSRSNEVLIANLTANPAAY